MKKAPTQYELATLAATIQGAPLDRAQAALAIWKACGETLEHEAEFQARVESRAQADESTDAQFPPGERLSFEAFLKAILPASKPERRAKMFRDFARDYIPATRRLNAEYGFPGGDELSPAALENRVADWMASIRTEGLSRATANSIAPHFAKFVQRTDLEQRTQRGKAGAAAKNKNSACQRKTARKSPQAKRKPRQA